MWIFIISQPAKAQFQADQKPELKTSSLNMLCERVGNMFHHTDAEGLFPKGLGSTAHINN